MKIFKIVKLLNNNNDTKFIIVNYKSIGTHKSNCDIFDKKIFETRF